MSAQPLDLSRPRGLGDLLGTTLSLYARHFWLFAGLAVAIVVVVDTIVFGIAAGWLWKSYDPGESEDLLAIEFLLPVLVLVPLISAAHAQAVVKLGEGQVPTFAETLQASTRHFAPVLAVVAMYTFGSLFALLLLIVPGVYLWIAWFVAAPAAVVEGKRGRGALGRSRDLVRGSWWRAFGIAITITLISASGLLVMEAAEALADATDSMAVYLAGWIVSDVVLFSFTALASTLLFFDLRARRTMTVAMHPRAAEG
jgi:hypothetical protein